MAGLRNWSEEPHVVIITAQQKFTCSKTTIETLRKDVEYVQR